MKKIRKGYYEENYLNARIDAENINSEWNWSIFWKEEVKSFGLVDEVITHNYKGTSESKKQALTDARNKYLETTTGSDYEKVLEDLYETL